MTHLGEKATQVLATAAEMSDAAGRAFDPVICFLCALDLIDPQGMLAPVAAREAALQRILNTSRANEASAQSTFQRLVDHAFLEATVRSHQVVYPVDILRACIDVAEPAIVTAFGDVDVQHAFRLDEIENLVPAGLLDDRPMDAEPPDDASIPTTVRFVVVVSGPDFQDMKNRYATLPDAQSAANSLSMRAFGAAMFPPSEPGTRARSIAILVPKRLREATRIEIREL